MSVDPKTETAQLADVMHQETGKPHGDAVLESALAIDHLGWAASHAAPT